MSTDYYTFSIAHDVADFTSVPSWRTITEEAVKNLMQTRYHCAVTDVKAHPGGIVQFTWPPAAEKPEDYIFVEAVAEALAERKHRTQLTIQRLSVVVSVIAAIASVASAIGPLIK